MSSSLATLATPAEYPSTTWRNRWLGVFVPAPMTKALARRKAFRFVFSVMTPW